MLNRSIQPQFDEVQKLPDIHFEKCTTSNGVEVFSVVQQEHDVVKLDMVFPAGTAYQEHPLQAKFTNSLFDSGTVKLSAFNIAEGFDYYGSYIESSCGKDFATITLYSLRKHLVDSLKLLREVVENASFPEEELEIHRNTSKQRYLINSGKVSSLAKREFNKLIYNSGSSYYNPVSQEDFDFINKKHLDDHFSQRYLGSKPVFFISGNTGTDELKALDSIMDINWGKSIENKTDLSLQNPAYRKVKKSGAVQSAIRMGKALFSMHHKDYPGLMVLNTVLGGYFGSRLMTNIREDKGYTYGIGSGLISYKNSGLFYIVTEVGRDVTDATMDEIQKEIKALQTSHIGDEELSLVKNYMLGGLLKRTNGAFSQSEMLKKTVMLGMDTSYYKSLESTIRTISAEEILRLAQGYLQIESLTTVIAGDFA